MLSALPRKADLPPDLRTAPLPTLRERRHRGLARRFVAVRRRERGNCGGLLTPVLPLLCYWRLLRRPNLVVPPADSLDFAASRAART